MGISLQQYRTTIGLFSGGSRARSNNNNSDSSSISSDSSDNSDSTSINISDSDIFAWLTDNTNDMHHSDYSAFVAKGPWKAYCVMLMYLILMIMAESCKDSMLLMSGVESNPGPQPKDLSRINEILAQLCVNAPEMEPGPRGHSKFAIRDCIRKYDPSISPHTDTNNQKQNKNFTSVDRDVLLKTVEYLGGSDMTDYTKPACINEVITKIDHHLPHSCQICSDEFEIQQGVNSLLDCDRCGRGIHQECLLKHIKHPAAGDNSAAITQVDIIKLVNPLSLPGWRYLCKACDTLVIPSKEMGKYKRRTNVARRNDNQVSFSTDQPTAGASQAADTSHHPTDEVDESGADTPELDFPPVLHRYQDPPDQSETRNNHDNHASPANMSQTPNAPNKRVCKFYLQNKCKYGLTGKGSQGTGCKFSHPKPCNKYTSHGTGPGGCKKGKKCEKFHPRMCRDSLQHQLCQNTNCTYLHTKGTIRTPNNRQNPNHTGHRTEDRYNKQGESSNTNKITPATEEYFLGLIDQIKQELFHVIDQRVLQSATNQSTPLQQSNQIHPHFLKYPNPVPQLPTQLPTQHLPMSYLPQANLY